MENSRESALGGSRAGNRVRTDDLLITNQLLRSVGQTPLQSSYDFGHASEATVWIHISSASFTSSVMKSGGLSRHAGGGRTLSIVLSLPEIRHF